MKILKTKSSTTESIDLIFKRPKLNINFWRGCLFKSFKIYNHFTQMTRLKTKVKESVTTGFLIIFGIVW
jgi:hypothetical protein